MIIVADLLARKLNLFCVLGSWQMSKVNLKLVFNRFVGLLGHYGFLKASSSGKKSVATPEFQAAMRESDNLLT